MFSRVLLLLGALLVCAVCVQAHLPVVLWHGMGGLCVYMCAFSVVGGGGSFGVPADTCCLPFSMGRIKDVIVNVVVVVVVVVSLFALLVVLRLKREGGG